MWLLARTPTVSDALLERFVRRAAELGFESDKLIFPKQN
ncbi:MAG: lipocalin family protein [Nitrosomonas sp.]|nr:lipocalin family protein [Nitrosomonas sp.]UJP02265.1 MAG: lipocalin family protein [Nitrosomonas sp.]